MEKTPTMTLHECCEAMRANLISVSEEKIGQGIIDGIFPFAYGIPGRENVYIIFRYKFYQWLEENLGGKACEI